jgi:hypothetical protein
VFGSALIKKRRYWPKYIDGDGIQRHFVDKEVGDADALPGTLDGQKFHIFAMKEPDYTMMLMSTYGSLNEMAKGDTARTWTNSAGETVTQRFKYREPFFNHFKFCHGIDDHNAKRHSPISIEETWATKWWPNRVFSFLLAVTEVNSKLAHEYFSEDPKQKTSMLDFRQKLAEEMINYGRPVHPDDDSPPNKWHRATTIPSHELLHPPPFTGKWVNGKRNKCRTQYLQRLCSCGK